MTERKIKRWTHAVGQARTGIPDTSSKKGAVSYHLDHDGQYSSHLKHVIHVNSIPRTLNRQCSRHLYLAIYSVHHYKGCWTDDSLKPLSMWRRQKRK